VKFKPKLSSFLLNLFLGMKKPIEMLRKIMDCQHMSKQERHLQKYDIAFRQREDFRGMSGQPTEVFMDTMININNQKQ